MHHPSLFFNETFQTAIERIGRDALTCTVLLRMVLVVRLTVHNLFPILPYLRCTFSTVLTSRLDASFVSKPGCKHDLTRYHIRQSRASQH